jgi:galactoside O-acetyltransferase
MNSFYSAEELSGIGFKSVGAAVFISRKASFYNPEAIKLGHHVRIDDFSILSGGSTGITIGNYVHISPYSAVYGGGGVVMEDYTGLSPRCILFSETDDFSGESMVHPFFPSELKPGYRSGTITLRKFSQIGTNSTVLPDVELKEGVAVGAHSLVTKSCEPWGIYVGVPAKRIKERSRKLLELERQFLEMQDK